MDRRPQIHFRQSVGPASSTVVQTVKDPGGLLTASDSLGTESSSQGFAILVQNSITSASGRQVHASAVGSRRTAQPSEAVANE